MVHLEGLSSIIMLAFKKGDSLIHLSTAASYKTLKSLFVNLKWYKPLNPFFKY